MTIPHLSRKDQPPPVKKRPALPHLEEIGPGHIVGNDQEDAEEDGHWPPRYVILVLQITLLVVVFLNIICHLFKGLQIILKIFYKEFKSLRISGAVFFKAN
jgi:hypothetical protein